MSTGVEGLVAQIERAKADLDAQMADPELSGDRLRYTEVTRRYSALQQAFDLVAAYRDMEKQSTEAEEILAEEEDADMRTLLRESRDEIERLAPLIREAMIEPDPADDKDVIVEVRAGTVKRMWVDGMTSAVDEVFAEPACDDHRASRIVNLRAAQRGASQSGAGD